MARFFCANYLTELFTYASCCPAWSPVTNPGTDTELRLQLDDRHRDDVGRQLRGRDAGRVSRLDDRHEDDVGRQLCGRDKKRGAARRLSQRLVDRQLRGSNAGWRGSTIVTKMMSAGSSAVAMQSAWRGSTIVTNVISAGSSAGDFFFKI